MRQLHIAETGANLMQTLKSVEPTLTPYNTCGYYFDKELTKPVKDDSVIDSSTTVYTKMATNEKFNFILRHGMHGNDNEYYYSVEAVSKDISGEIVVPQMFGEGDASHPVWRIQENGFENCTGLTSMVLPYGLIDINKSAFAGCDNLRDLKFPETLEVIRERAFACSYSRYSTTPIWQDVLYFPKSLNSVEIRSFAGRQYKKFDIDPENETFIVSGNCLIGKNKTLYLGCSASVIPTDGSVTRFRNYAFLQVQGLTEVTIPDSVTTSEGCIFEGAIHLQTVNFGTGLATVTALSFSGCRALTTINWGNSKFTKIGFRAFEGSGLQQVTIPATVTTVEYRAFGSCSKLTSVSFDDPTGWGIEGTSVDVSNPTDNAVNFKNDWYEVNLTKT